MRYSARKSNCPTWLEKKASSMRQSPFGANRVMLGAAAVAASIALLLLVLPTSELRAQTNSAPTIYSSGVPTNVTTGQRRTISATATDVDRNIIGWRWFLDGVQQREYTFLPSARAERVVSYTFSTAGTYTFKLEFFDEGGLTVSFTATVEVTDPIDPPPLPDNSAPSVARVSPTSSSLTLTKGSTQTFSARATDDDDNISEWEWYVEDELQGGQSLSLTGDVTKQFSYTFSSAGDYEVEVEFVDDQLESDSVTWSVEVPEPITTVGVTVASSPSGRTVTVDGTDHTAPYSGTWNSGSSHTLNVPSPQNISGVSSRYVFSSWSQGGSQSQTVSPISTTTYTANFTQQHFLSTRTEPRGIGIAGGGTWYNHGATATVGPAPSIDGYEFSYWRKGGAGGSNIGTDPASVSVTVDAPFLVEAVYIASDIVEPITVQLGAASYTVDEDDRKVDITVTMSQSRSESTSVLIQTTDGTADSPQDYTRWTSIPVTFNANTTSQTVSITIFDDLSVERSETFTVKLTRSAGLPDSVVVSGASATVTIEDNDQATLALEAEITVNENHASFQATVEVVSPAISCPIEFPIAVPLSYSDPDGALASGSPVQSPVEFLACQRSGDFEVEIGDVRGTEEVEFWLDRSGSGAVLTSDVLLSSGRLTVTILDSDDPSVTVEFEDTYLFVRENDGEVDLTVRISSSPIENVSVNLLFGSPDDTATLGSRYYDFQPTVRWIRFDADTTTLTQTVSVTIRDDVVVELPESFFVKLQLASETPSFVIIDQNHSIVEVEIIDDDAGTVGFDPDEIVVTEGESFELEMEVLAPDSNCPIQFQFDAHVSYSDPDGALSSGSTVPSSLEFDGCQIDYAYDFQTSDDSGGKEVVFTLDELTLYPDETEVRMLTKDPSTLTVRVLDSSTPVSNHAPTVSRVSPSSSSLTLTAGASRTFTVRATDADSNITSYEWTVNDSGVGNSGTLTATGDVTRAHTHPFPSAGTHTVRAEFTDSDGATGSTSWRVEVEAPQTTTNSAPSVSRVSPATSTISLVKGDEQTFEVNAIDPDGNLTKWKWEVNKNGLFGFLGQGHEEPEVTFSPTNSTTTTFAHTFPDDGTYTVTVTFTDSAGESGTAEWTVKVVDAPVSFTCGVEPIEGSSLVAGKLARVYADLTAREDVTDVYVHFTVRDPSRGLSDEARTDKEDIDEDDTARLEVEGVFISGDGFIVECAVKDAGLLGNIDRFDKTLATKQGEPFSVAPYTVTEDDKDDLRGWLRSCGPGVEPGAVSSDGKIASGGSITFDLQIEQNNEHRANEGEHPVFKGIVNVYKDDERVWSRVGSERTGRPRNIHYSVGSWTFTPPEPGQYSYDCILISRRHLNSPAVSALTTLPKCVIALANPLTFTLCAIVFVYEFSQVYQHQTSISSSFCVGDYPDCPFEFAGSDISPSAVRVGQPVRLSFRTSGLNGDAVDHGGVSVSFPDLTDVGTDSSEYEYISDRASVSTVSYTTGESNVAYHRPGETITTETGTTASAGYLLVESDDRSWPEDADRTLVLEVTPWEPGTLSVQYRYWLCLEGYDDCRRRPESGGTDQQGWHVGVSTITVNAVLDRDELVEFHGETDGANWDDDTNWLSHEPLDDWYGVATGTDDRVTGLELSDNGLSGEIPAVIGDLTELQLLDLGDNGLRGEIPADLESLTKLRELKLFRNRLSGEIPEGLGDLSALERLDLGENDLDGEIPTALGSLSKLQTLSLYDNDLARSIPTELGNLSSLKELNLSRNKLSGEIPVELGKLTSLEVLDLSDNSLSGAIPPGLGSLTKLDTVYLSGNNLDSGCIPALWRDLSHDDDLDEVDLPFCDVALSSLTISPGELSPEFDPGVSRYTAEVEQSPVTITLVTGHGATFELLDGEGDAIPDADTGIAGHQVVVVFGGTAVTIEVTSQDGRNSHSYTIDVVLSGEADAPTIASVTPGASSLEVSWGAPTDVRDDYITSYDLRHIDSSASDKADSSWTVLDDVWSSGALSHTVRGLLAGTEYDVQVRAGTSAGSTEWSEAVGGTPEEGECTTEGAADSPGQASDCETALEVLDALSGSGTSTLDWASDNSVEDWDGVEVDPTTGKVTRLELDGDSSPEVQTTSLRTLTVRQTAMSTADLLTGEIPPELGSLAELEYLSLADNLLGGEIPSELGRLSELTSLRLQGNELSGRIPPELADLSMLVELKLSGNDLTGCVREGLHSIADNDLDELSLPVCGPSVELSVATTSIAVRIGTPIGVTATFGESVTGFTVGDIDVTNGSAANLSGSGSVYAFEVFPNAVGVVTVDMGAGVAAAASDGDGSEAADRLTLGIPYDDDGDGAISLPEAIKAVQDYFAGLIPLEQAIRVIQLYFLSLG